MCVDHRRDRHLEGTCGQSQDGADPHGQAESPGVFEPDMLGHQDASGLAGGEQAERGDYEREGKGG